MRIARYEGIQVRRHFRNDLIENVSIRNPFALLQLRFPRIKDVPSIVIKGLELLVGCVKVPFGDNFLLLKFGRDFGFEIWV